MPTPKPSDAEDDSADTIGTNTPAKRKSINNTKSPKDGTPRRANATVKRAANEGPNPSTPKRNVTTTEKKNGNGATPNSATPRAKTGNSKKAEPTLLGDFLLGRPSPARQRRKSLDVVKAEMKAANVGMVKQPGGVKDRVKQWQKANAVVGVDDPNATIEEEEGKKVLELEGVDEDSVDEAERLRIKFRKGQRPGRRKSREEDKEEKEDKEEAGLDEDKPRSASAPRKRVISDDHWMKNKSPKGSPTPGKGAAAGQKITKDFLAKTTVKEPLARRIDDWAKKTESPPNTQEDKPRSKKSVKEDSDDGIRVRPRSNSIDLLFSPNPKDDDIRIKPSDSPRDDGIRIKPLKESFEDGGIRVKPVRKDGSKRRPKEPDDDGDSTPTRRSDKHLMPPSNHGSKRTSSQGTSQREKDDKFSCTTPSPPEGSRRRNRKSATPDSDIPVGNSAFSVLDLPLGAEAGTMRRAQPKRNNSFGVPKVLKKVYTEGMKIVHDAPEPPRGGPNQPPSIETWLSGTTDPFIDRPGASTAGSMLDVLESTGSRKCSYNDDDRAELEMTAEAASERSGSRRRRRTRKSVEKDELAKKSPQPDDSPLITAKARDILPSIENSSPFTPSGLRRSPATRNTSSPKSARKSALKDAIFDAFKGESAMAGAKVNSPFVKVTGLRERDVNLTPPDFKSSGGPSYGSDDTPSKRSPRAPEKSSFDESNDRVDKLPSFPRRPAPTTGEHRLSTIASVETMSTISSATETASGLSKTTLTQVTELTGPTSSSLSRKSNQTGLSRNKNNKPGLKRRLTKHSDLISVLSLPDEAQPGRAKSIRSARSIRTTRTHLETATIQDVMRELAEDETKYMRELKTLVDGVIPVLLTCVLSKSNSAIAAGLFDPANSSSTDSSFTKPIVDMGVALERLKSLHKRIPLEDSDAFITWAFQAHKTYEDYLAAWRTGFQDVVVNLAPASRSSSSDMKNKSKLDEMPRNEHGDVVGAHGERVDVAYLLKRPLVRIKFLNKLLKLKRTEASTKTMETYQELEALCRRRVKEEEARRVDQAANNTDASRARDIRTLAPIDGVKIDRTRQVCAKDFFSLDLSHSNCQRIECRVEVLFRDKPSDSRDDGDLLICEVNENRRFLLFPPVAPDRVSARLGEHKNQLAVMIRGVNGTTDWSESFILDGDEDGAAEDWIEMLGTNPVPPPIVRKELDLSEEQLSQASTALIEMPKPESPAAVDIPIGERRRREAEESNTQARDRQRSSRISRLASSMPDSIKEESVVSEPDAKDLNDTMDKAGSPLVVKRARAARYHGRSQSTPTTPFIAEMSGALDPYPDETTPPKPPGKIDWMLDDSPDGVIDGPTDLPYIPKVRKHSTDTAKHSTPLKESMRPEPNVLKKQQPPTTPTRYDGAPPPPVHRLPTTPNALSKTPPALDSPTSRGKNRRSSSPLKHEYQPSDASGTSSCSETSDSQTSDSYTESSEEDELEATDTPGALPQIYGKRISPSGSMYTIPNTSLAPSNSASQASYQGVPVQRSPATTKKNTAMLSCWDAARGKWVDLNDGKPCSIVITPGLIEAFSMSAAHSSPHRPGLSDDNQGSEVAEQKPLLAQVLTPHVPMRQSTALDIEINSRPTVDSTVKTSSFTIRYRTLTNQDCIAFYSAIHRARIDNPVWKKLEFEREMAAYGTNTYDDAVAGNRRRSWFGRKKSYRASTRAPSETAETEASNKSRSSAFSALRRLSGSSMFNISKSSVDTSNPRVPSSGPTSTSPSEYSGVTPPRTPSSPGSFFGSSYSISGAPRNLGSENLKIRLYQLVSQGSKWNDMGSARLTVTVPPPGMRQASSLDTGIQRRIIVTRKRQGEKDGKEEQAVLIDVVLGANCYSMLGRTGVAVNIWEDIRGDDGRLGVAGAYGGVSATTRKYLFQNACAADANWIYGLLAVGRQG